MAFGDDFDTKVRAPLWHAIEDAFGEEYHTEMGESGWLEEYYELEKRLKRKLGKWRLSNHLQAGNAIQEFLKAAPRDQIVTVIDVTMEFGKEAFKPEDFEQLKARLQEIRDIADEGVAHPSRGPDERWYDTAQICVNGHIVNRQADSHPEANTKFCKECGGATTKRCGHCDARIRGYKHIPNYSYTDDSPAPKFCHECGKAYPWTEAQRSATEAQIMELENLSEADKLLLQSSLDDIIRDTPRTETAVVRFKKLLPKAGKEAAEVVRRMLISLAAEGAKKLLTGGAG
jgi:hypothetical protein